MLSIWMVSLLFLAVGLVVLASGIFTLQYNHQAPANRAFFALTVAITIWSSGMALSTIAPDAATGEIWRRFSAIGWGATYAILLHFVLIITDKPYPYRKWWFYGCLYLPALIMLFAFVIPNRMNPYPYLLHYTNYGWINVAQNNVWDWIFYLYYIGFTVLGLVFLYQWGKKSSDESIKKKSRLICLAIIIALILGTLTDVVLSSLYSELPQMAPVIMLIPVLAIYHILQKDSFGITEGVDRKTSYMNIFICVLMYLILTAMQFFVLNGGFAKGPVTLDESTIKGIIVQLQMFISLYLVLKENRPGYIVSFLMNAIALVATVGFMIRFNSTESLPGIISHTGVLVIITLIRIYKEKNAAYIKKINTQIVKEKFYSSVFKQAPVGIAIMNGQKHTRYEEFADININPMYEQILGRTKEELQNLTWPEITHPEDIAVNLAYYEQFEKGNIDHYSLEKRLIKPDGSVVWVNMVIAPFSASGEKSDDHVCIITDITERKEMEAALKYSNENVPLTGLYNRSVMERILKRDALLPWTDKRGLVYINLSSIHALNPRYGFHYNQVMLKKIANSLKVFCNDNYILFNTYDDRFIFYVKGYKDKNELLVFCEAVADTINSHLYIHGITAGIGVIEIDEAQMRDIDELLRMLLITSEMAAKNNIKGNSIIFYGPEIEAQATRENEISQELTEIAEGIRPERLYLQFQPIIDLSSNRLCAFEALARLNSEKYGLIPPLEFIAIAEKNNMIVPLGEKIILQALSFLKKLKENGHDNISVSINISMIQLLNAGFAEKFIDSIKERHLDPENIGIELTESVFTVEIEEINTVINSLKAAGIKILIDDFGTGYSSFARGSELNIDSIKIDKCFIDKLLTVKPEEAITGDIISIAHKLGQCVIAEGVEQEKQRCYLRDYDCDRIQGYLISKPLDEEAALAFLNEKMSSCQNSAGYQD
ncbi:MAG: EAL domain-containing protein [Peptococcaceae bacterium]|nr:EAL domain-containing protein [Peptococcaceae bacterium]